MRQTKLLFALAALLTVTVVAGCGGDDGPAGVPDDAVAVVGDESIQKTEFQQVLSQAKKTYVTQKRTFPSPGTREYDQLKNQFVQYLVQREQFEQEGEELGVTVTDEQVDKRLKELKKQYFNNDEKKYTAQLKQSGLTDEQVKKDLRANLIQEGIFKKVTGEVKVTDAKIQKYYKDNIDNYRQPESREVRHILVGTKKQANDLYGRIKGGESFEKLAKQFSKDPGSKTNGGRLTISRGQTVPPFDQTAFLLNKGVLSRPVKTQYGFHLIEPLSNAKPAKVTRLNKQVKDQIRQQLEQNEKNTAMTKWVEDTRKQSCSDTAYQVGFKPPAAQDPCAKKSTGTGTTSTTTTGS